MPRQKQPVVHAGRTFDRLVRFDRRSRKFPVTAIIREGAKPRSYTWACPVWLDQGTEGACTGFSTAQEGAANPAPIKGVTNDIARQIYKRAQQLDEWPGENYEGSSVLGAVKAATERGWYGEYRWAFSIDDLVLALGYKGPAILGIPWTEGMMTPDKDGFIRPTGKVAGGHAILARGVQVRKDGTVVIRLHNSWGRDWGKDGDCFILASDLAKLLKKDGEACIPVIRKNPAKP